MRTSAGRRVRAERSIAGNRLIEVLADSAKNEVYMAMVLPRIYITAIDDEAIYQPISKREVEALIQKLDEEGIQAVMQGVQEHFGTQDAEKDKAALKN